VRLARANGWTDGQYSLYRALFGTYLAAHLASLLPWAPELFSSRGVLPDGALSPLLHLYPNVLRVLDSPAAATALVATGLAASILFTVGVAHRAAALVTYYVWACLIGRDPLIANPGLPFVGWLLVLHVFVPPRPWGSVSGRGQPDAGAGFTLPQPLHRAAWALLALTYAYSGYTKLASPSWIDGSALAYVLDSPLARPGALRDLLAAHPALLRGGTWASLALELGFAPLALFGALRPWLWGALLGMHLCLLALVAFADLSLGMIVVHLFTFDPAWIPPRGGRAVLFYDGTCGLCHRSVRFFVSEDRAGALAFAPLAGATFQALPEEARRGLPDSLVLSTPDGALLVRSRAVLACLQRLGGAWRVLAGACAIVPTGLRDLVYDAVALVRYRLFRRPAEACPVTPPEVRARFLP
jgi:predicted DCC family thiol-disulfide oxidoreductase YuxK